jgi:type VI protein secretion system component Hcp
MTMSNRFHSNRLSPSLKGKKKVSRICLLLLTLVFLFSFVSFALAAPTAYMFVEDGAIIGDAKRKGFEDAIELFGELTYGVQQFGEWEEGSQITGRVTIFSDITIQKIPDRASSAIMRAIGFKTQFDRVEIIIPSKGSDTILTLEKVIIRSAQTRVGLKGKTQESVSLSYRKITWEIKGVVTSYDLESVTE